MPTRKLSFRLDEELVERLKAEAGSRGETVSAAASRLITCALDSDAGCPTERPTASDSTRDDLHDYVDTLKDQLEKKDRLIESLTAQHADLTRVTEQLGKVADQAQQLHALAAKSQATDHDGAEDVSAMKGEIADLRAKVEQQDENKRRGWLSRLFG